jgi:hypothetical protein
MLTTKTSDGHPIFSSVGTDYQNESLQIGVFDEFFDEKLIKEHEQSIRKIVGKNIDITFANEGDGYKASSCSQTGDCNPIQGGVMITFEDGGSCSMGFKASYDDKDGFVSAGHCLETRGATGNDVGNPSASGSDLLGTVHANAMDYYTWCDCLFVDSSETTSGKIYSNIDPSGTYYPADEDWVLMEGFATQGSSGQIEDTYKSVWVESPWGYWYYLQGAVDTNYSGSSGDSGGPVYETGSNDFAGIHSAHDSTTGKSLYVPYYRITNAFSGLSLGI